MAEAQVGDASRLPPVLAILPFRNKVLLPGAIVKIRVNAPARFVVALFFSFFSFSFFGIFGSIGKHLIINFS